MNKKFIKAIALALIIVISSTVLVSCGKDAWKVENMSADAYGDLPIVRINTEDGKNPVDKENYVNCSFEITNCTNPEHNFKVSMKESFDYEEDDGGVGVRLRGNTTMAYDKKPYRVKFEKSKSLFGLQKAKSWVLLADYLDQSNMRNYVALTLGNDVFDNLDFTANPNHVILEFNGEYKGVYLLCEQIDEKKGRANVEVDEEEFYTNYQNTEFPFLIEMDEYVKNDASIADGDKVLLDGYFPIEIKYPEAKDRGTYNGQDIFYDYLTEYLTAVKTTLKTGEKVSVSFRPNPVGLEDLVDVNSLIDYNLLNEFMYNPDSMWKSSYMHKSVNKVDENGNVIEYSKLKFGPVWDFDFTMGGHFTDKPFDASYIGWARANVVFASNIFFADYLKDNNNYALVQSRWNQVKDKIKIVANKIRDYKEYISKPSKVDAKRWYGENGDFQFDMQYDYVRLFLLDRLDYFNEIFALDHVGFLTKVEIPI